LRVYFSENCFLLDSPQLQYVRKTTLLLAETPSEGR